MSGITFDERKQNLCDLVSEMHVDADKILKVAPQSIPYQVKSMLKASPEELSKSLDAFLEQIDEESRAEFLEMLIHATDQLRKGHVDLMDNLNRRIQPEGQPRTPPREFKGFKKRKGSW